MSDTPHISVMLPEVLTALAPAAGAHIVDGTFGAGGYSRAFLESGATVTAFDRDPTARRFAAPPGGFSLTRRLRSSNSGPRFFLCLILSRRSSTSGPRLFFCLLLLHLGFKIRLNNGRLFRSI
jgi:hypothetical protein